MEHNKKIAEIFYEIAEYLEMENVPFKPRAYQKAAEILENLEEDVSLLYKKGGIKSIENIPGIGKSLAEKIEEFIKSNKIKYYEELKKKIPVKLNELRNVEGLGPKSIKKLYEKLHITNLEELKKAAQDGKIRNIEGFGIKSEEKILKSIEFLNKSQGRFLLYKIIPEVEKIKKELEKTKGTKKVVIAGSIRRMKETVGDVDILAVSKKHKEIINRFVKIEGVEKIIAQGETKAAIKLSLGINVDLRVVEEKSFGAALNYFTGSKEHNIALRELALKKNLKLNEYGIFKIEKNKEIFIGGENEEEIYQILGMDYIAPELRENKGEIELALKHNLPKIIEYNDLKGDLQVQTNWSDGENSIEEVAEAAIKLGLEYIAITDHTKSLSVAKGLDEKRILKQIEEIDKLNAKFKKEGINFTILKGTECDILKDGSLDLPDSILKKLDIVGASVHSYFNLPLEEQTKRIIKAMKNPYVDIIFHPTGRIIQKREAYAIDIEEIIKVAGETNTILEIDAYPDRLDLKDEYIRKCVEKNVKLSIDSDAHAKEHLLYLKYGIAQARRGFATKKDIINAWPLQKMKKLLKRSLF
jgi:DNA polymerase (family 10)